jgi:alpha-L-rhamnosidase
LALYKNKRHDLAYGLLQQTSYPSWLYSVDNGATTIWERLNSYTNENGFGGNNSMNSFNHYSFGSVAAWMYMYSIGIQRDPEVAAFKKFILQPTPDPERKMKWAKGYYNSSYGKIESAWKWNTTGWDYRAVIPPNTTAIFKIEHATPKQVLLEGKRVRKNKNGVIQIYQKEDELHVELMSGTYNFKILNP